MPKSNTDNYHTIFEMNNGELGPHVLFFNLHDLKISQLKFEAHKFERVQWSCIKEFVV